VPESLQGLSRDAGTVDFRGIGKGVEGVSCSVDCVSFLRYGAPRNLPYGKGGHLLQMGGFAGSALQMSNPYSQPFVEEKISRDLKDVEDCLSIV
jgi:hypothetical protein